MSQLTLSDCSGCVHNCNTAHRTETIPDQVMSQLTLSDCSGCVHNCNTAHWTETIPDQFMSQLTLSNCSGCVHNCNTAHWTETIPNHVMSQLTLSDCSGCVHNCNTVHWTETIPDQVLSQLTLSDWSFWLWSLQFSAGRRHVTLTVYTVAHCSRLTSQFSQLSTTAPHNLSRFSTAEQPSPYYILSWCRQLWPAIRWHYMQHDVTEVLKV